MEKFAAEAGWAERQTDGKIVETRHGMLAPGDAHRSFNCHNICVESSNNNNKNCLKTRKKSSTDQQQLQVVSG